MEGKCLPSRKDSGDIKEPTGQRSFWQGGCTFGDTTVGRDNIQIGNLHADGNVVFNLSHESGSIMKAEAALFLTDPADDREKLISAKGKRVPGTCEWIRTNNTYLSWLNSRSQLLWLTGGPGKGKTMLSIFLTEELTRTVEQSQDRILVYYFCDNRDEKRNTAVAILRGLLFQILRKRRNLAKHFLEEFEFKGESLLSSFESLWRLFETVVRDHNLDTIYCVLDGLDECDEVSLEVLMKKFKAFFSVTDPESPTGGLKLIAVSRKLPQRVAGELYGFPRVKLDPDSDDEIISDIQRFISVKIDELSAVITGLNDKLRRHVEKSLLEGAEGTFLWVGFVTDELRGKRSTELIDTLGSLPSGLPGIYGRMLLQIQDSRRETAALILRWVVMAIRPLTLTELAVAVKVRPSATASSDQIIRDYIGFCGTLLKVTGNEVGLVHQSAKDYFLRKEPDNDPTLEHFRVKEAEASLEIARTCFHYIHSGAFSDGPVALLSDTPTLRSFPFLNYAVLYWPEHARRSSDSIGSMFDLSGSFCQKKSVLFAAWWQTYWSASEPGDVPELFSMLHLASYFGILPLALKLFMKGAQKIKLKFRNPANKKDSLGRTPLSYAAERGHDRIVELLIKKRADVNGQGEHVGTALQEASAQGHDRVVELLLESGADVNAHGKYGGTALQKASAEGHDRVVELLLANGANVNDKGEGCHTALQAASYGGHDRIVELLLKKGADVNEKSGGYVIWQERARYTALQAASHGGHDRIVELLLENGADVNERGRSLGTALQAASFSGHYRILELLLEKGADVNAPAGTSGTALQAASESGHDMIVELLLEKGADINAKGGASGTALQAASYSGCGRIVEMLLEKGADVNAPAVAYGGTALQAASYSGHDRIAELLLEKEADVNAPGGAFGTALQAASAQGYGRIVELLLKKGAEVNMTGENGGTALMAASFRGHARIFGLLLENGADVNAQGGTYGMALQAASQGGHGQIVELLLREEADVNIQGGIYGTALQAASHNGHDRIVELLLKKGADVNAQDGASGTALQAASYQGHDRIIEILLKKGANVNAQGGTYDTALQAASYSGHDRIVELLLEKGADVNAQGGAYNTALQAASFNGHDRIVELLLKEGADANAKGGTLGTALQTASYSGYDRIVELLLEKGADVNAQAGAYGTALQAASGRGYGRIVELLQSASIARSR